MPFLGSGRTLQIAVPAGYSLFIKTFSGSVSVTGGGVAKSCAENRGAGTVYYGPTSASTSMTITTTGDCEYQILDGDPGANSSLSSRLSGVGYNRLGTAVIIGDSIIANGSNATNGYRNNRSIVQHAMRQLGRPYKVVNEVGFSGETTDQILARWDTQVAPYKPGIVYWESGTNDFSAGRTSAQILSSLIQAKQRAESLGARFVYIGAPQNTVPPALLNMVRQYAREDSSFEYTGGSNRLLDYTGTTAQLAAPTLLTNAQPDGTHQSAYGANLWAQDIVLYEQRRGFKAPPFFSAIGGPGGNSPSTGNYLSNLTANGLVGAAGANWSTQIIAGGTRTPVTSVQNMGTTGLQAGLPGRLYRAVWSPAVSPTTADKMITNCTWDLSGAAAQYAGRTFIGRCYAKVTSTGGNIHGAYLSALAYDWTYGNSLGSGFDNYLFDPGSMSTWSMATTSYEGYFETTPITLPSTWTTPTDAHFTCSITVNADTGATVTVDVGCAEFTEVFTL